jgi:hypothetical protein
MKIHEVVLEFLPKTLITTCVYLFINLLHVLFFFVLLFAFCPQLASSSSLYSIISHYIFHVPYTVSYIETGILRVLFIIRIYLPVFIAQVSVPKTQRWFSGNTIQFESYLSAALFGKFLIIRPCHSSSG